MATLNDVPFKIIRQVFTTVQNNSIKDILGSDTVSVEHMGYSTEPLRLVCFVQNEDEYDNFKEEYHSSGTKTLIIHENSGRQYTVYGLSSTTEIDGEIENYKQGIVFLATFKQATPYKESTEEITRTKSIITQNQEWTADNDGNDVKTLGNVDAVPDIQVTGAAPAVWGVDATYNSPATFPNGLTWDGTNIWSCDPTANLIYKHNADMTVNTSYAAPGPTVSGLTWDGTNIWSCDNTNEKIYKHNADMTVNTTYNSPSTGVNGLTWDGSNIWSCDFDIYKIYKHNADMTVNTTYNSPSTFPSGLAWDGSNIWSCDNTSDKIYKHHTDITVFTSYDTEGTTSSGLTWDGSNIWCSDSILDEIHKMSLDGKSNLDVDVYNTADTTVKCRVGNTILYSAIYRINADGTGTIDYDDDFTTNRYSTEKSGMSGISISTGQINIADDGYIYWKKDTKFPITGTPTLTARINITAGTPTIQISTDASTWYDIDTAIVDDVETVYPIDSDGNLSLAGKTVFYWRIDCVKAAAATCSIKYFKLDIAIHTIYAKNPKITKGASASTFRCDQDPDSGLACEVALIFRHRWWT